MIFVVLLRFALGNDAETIQSIFFVVIQIFAFFLTIAIKNKLLEIIHSERLDWICIDFSLITFRSIKELVNGLSAFVHDIKFKYIYTAMVV